MLRRRILNRLEGPDEISVSLKEHPLLPRTQNCGKPVPGGSVMATANEVMDRKDAKLGACTHKS